MSYYVNWDVIRTAMKKKQVSDEMLAAELGVKRPTIVAWRYRKSGPVTNGPMLLDKLCKFLEIDKEELLNRDAHFPRKELYEELVTGMLHIIQFDNFIENNNQVFRGVLETKEYEDIKKAIKTVRKISSKAYITLENDRSE